MRWDWLSFALGVLGLLASFAQPILRYLGIQVGQLAGTILSGCGIAVACAAFAILAAGLAPSIVHNPVVSIVGAAVLGAILFGAEARLIYVYTHPPSPTAPRTPVTWDFTNVLSASGVRRGERGFWVSAFIFQGTSTKAINNIDGHVRSNINAEERMIYISTRDGLARPDQIQGVPPGARVEVISPFIPVVGTGLGDDPTKLLDEPTLLERFGDFSFVVALDGELEEHRFAPADVQRFIAASKRSLFGIPEPHVRSRQTPGSSPPTTREVPTAAKATPIVWRWDEGDHYFLGATGGVGDRTWIKGFQAAGRNASGRTIERFGGYIESAITGEQHALMVNLGGTLKPITETMRIPDGAEFDVGVRFPDQYPPTSIPPNETGVSADKFREQWRSFKFVFTYDGGKYARQFTADDVEKLLRRFHDETHRDVKPRVSPDTMDPRGPKGK